MKKTPEQLANDYCQHGFFGFDNLTRRNVEDAFKAGYQAAVDTLNVEVADELFPPAKDGCTCSEMNTEYEHTCPFSEEINDDSETMCSCCPECEHQCRMDI